MHIRLRQLAFSVALVFGASAIVAVPAMAQQDRNHDNTAQAQRTNPDTYANHPDYSNNEYYRTGNDEGYQDYKAHKQQKHEHEYRNDEDRRAHDYGYQEGWSGRSYRDNNDNRGRATSSERHDKDDVHTSGTYRDNQTDRDRDNQKHDKDDDLKAH